MYGRSVFFGSDLAAIGISTRAVTLGSLSFGSLSLQTHTHDRARGRGWAHRSPGARGYRASCKGLWPGRGGREHGKRRGQCGIAGRRARRARWLHHFYWFAEHAGAGAVSVRAVALRSRKGFRAGDGDGVTTLCIGGEPFGSARSRAS